MSKKLTIALLEKVLKDLKGFINYRNIFVKHAEKRGLKEDSSLTNKEKNNRIPY